MTARQILGVGESKQIAPICDELRSAGWLVHRATDLRHARRLIAQHGLTVALLVHTEVGDELCATLDAFLKSTANIEWIGCFDTGSVVRPPCRDLILAHLFDHHTLPLDMQRVIACIGHAYGRAALREAAETPATGCGDTMLLGESPAIIELMRQVRRTASAEAPVLIHGESGSGKELIAHAVHRNSARSRGPLVVINCGAIQPTLIQSELFGHEKGAFTGAIAAKRGLFEEAESGTVFLDEIGDLPLDLQVNLLRFLQEGTVSRVGSTKVRHIDVRVIAATNIDLRKAVGLGRFREDLFYRLNVLPLHVAPLRERRQDIRLLSHHFFRKFSGEKSAKLKGFSRLAMQAMQAHTWPGNVRELINRVRCSMIMAQGRLIMPVDLGLEAPSGPELQNVLDVARLKAEHGAITATLQLTGRNVATSARQLGVSRMTLYRLMVKHGMNVPQ